MAQNITLLGASYSDVPSVELPKTGGGTAQFDDTTIASNAASASDIANGKLAFVNGELVTGTASGGGATLITKSITANGTYNASSDNADGYSSVTVNVSGGGGGLEYEEGTWTPAEDIPDYTIPFANSHSEAPIMYMITDSGTDYFSTTNTNYHLFVTSPYLYCGALLKPSEGLNYYAIGNGRYRGTNATSFASAATITPTSLSSMADWMSESGIRAYTNAATRYWRAGRTYKWIAVWAPTS